VSEPHSIEILKTSPSRLANLWKKLRTLGIIFKGISSPHMPMVYDINQLERHAIGYRYCKV